MKTISQYIEFAKNFKTQSNENLLNFHEMLQEIKEGRFWKTKKFYKNQNTFDYKEYSKMDFYSFIKRVFGVTRIKFESIEKILSLDDGKELFIKYGRANIQTYYYSTDEERAAILNEVVTKNRLSTWAAIKRELYPNTKKIECVINPWKIKYEKVLKEFNDYKKTVESVMNGLKKAS